MTTNGCCCRFAEDGETQTEWCSVHAILREDRDRAVALASFFACVIKSGEPWTVQCESAFAALGPAGQAPGEFTYTEGRADLEMRYGVLKEERDDLRRRISELPCPNHDTMKADQGNCCCCKCWPEVNTECTCIRSVLEETHAN